MKSTGQIVEILSNSPLYNDSWKELQSLKEQLKVRSTTPKFNLFDGILIGGHQGTANFHIGQRKGVPISGSKKPLYVIALDAEENRIFVGAGKDHPGLFRDVAEIRNAEIAWEQIADRLPFTENEATPVTITFEETHQTTDAKLYHYQENTFIEFNKPLKINQQQHSIAIKVNDQLLAKTFINLTLI